MIDSTYTIGIIVLIILLVIAGLMIIRGSDK